MKSFCEKLPAARRADQSDGNAIHVFILIRSFIMLTLAHKRKHISSVRLNWKQCSSSWSGRFYLEYIEMGFSPSNLCPPRNILYFNYSRIDLTSDKFSSGGGLRKTRVSPVSVRLGEKDYDDAPSTKCKETFYGHPSLEPLILSLKEHLLSLKYLQGICYVVLHLNLETFFSFNVSGNNFYTNKVSSLGGPANIRESLRMPFLW